jgi:hypothetical protein
VQKSKRKSKDQARRGERDFDQTVFMAKKKRQSSNLRRAARLNGIPAQVADDKLDWSIQALAIDLTAASRLMRSRRRENPFVTSLVHVR